MICKNCGKEIDKKAAVCVHCGVAVKQKKSIFKRWWFWLIVVVVIGAVAAGGGEESAPQSGDAPTQQAQDAPTPETFEAVELKEMFADLEKNAMLAEEKYQNKNIEVTGEISNFDSDGAYISIKVVGADAWDFNSMQCYIKNDEQKNILIQKSVGDSVTLQGKVKSIGEVLGYTLDIKNIK